MSPLTPSQKAELDAMSETAITSIEEAVLAAGQASTIVEQLRKEGIEAAVEVVLTACWAQIWVVVLPRTLARLDEALTRLDLVEDESRPVSQAGSSREIRLQGVPVPLFVLLDDCLEATPA